MTETTEDLPNPLVAGRVPATALFNKINGELVVVTSTPLEESKHNEKYYIARSVMYCFGTDGDKIEGNLLIDKFGNVTDNFKVVALAEQAPVIYESQMNALAAEKITSKYPLTTQLNLVVAGLNRLAKEHDLLETPEFQALGEMVSYIDYCVQVNQTKKEHYANDPTVTYISDQTKADMLSRQMEGGLHEEIGPRTITGGSIFS